MPFHSMRLIAAGALAVAGAAVAHAQQQPGALTPIGVLPATAVVSLQVVSWVPAANGQVPPGAIVGGQEPGRNLPVCRAKHNNGVHPGKIVAQACNIGWGGREILVRDYEVLVGNPQALQRNPQAIRWLPESGGRVPPGAFIGGQEPGRSLPICRAGYNNGVHPGKLVAQNCNISWGGKEILLPRYEVMVVGPAGPQPLPAAGAPVDGNAVAKIATQNADLESLMQAIAADRAVALDATLKAQAEEMRKKNAEMASLNQQMLALRSQLQAARDPAQQAQMQRQIDEIRKRIEALAGASQMDMVRMQSLMNKQNQTYEMLTDLMKRMSQMHSQIVGNLR